MVTQDTDPAGFDWIDANDAGDNVFSFLRYGADGSVLACVANFSGVPHEGYRVGLPRAGRWDEVLNTDAEVYGGSGVGNLGGGRGDRPSGWHGQPGLGDPAGPAAGRASGCATRHSPTT